MILFLAAYVAGVLTIASPCILPVLPFVFARAGQPFLRNGLPMLVGMGLTFALVATLASVAGGWAVSANVIGRDAALGLLALFGLTLLLPTLATRVMQPLVSLGNRLSQSAHRGTGMAPSALLGVATGLLWAPCAGPVLGLILTGAAIGGANAHTSLLLATYAAGAATSLALALLIGGRVFAAMKRSLGAGERLRQILGAAVLAAVAAVALGADTGVLARLSYASASTAGIEQRLIDRLGLVPHAAAPAPRPIATAAVKPASSPAPSAPALPVEGSLPPLTGATAWLNSPPLTADALKGHVVLIDFWTYSCINCLRTLPYVRAWADKYRDQGLIVIGVHAPEFAFEKDVGNVEKALASLHISYPVAVDDDYAIWRGFNNIYWPAHYFVDAEGRIRHHHFGEGGYDESENVIRQLLAEAGHGPAPSQPATVSGQGIEAAPSAVSFKSPETYIGYARAKNFVSPGGAVDDDAHRYQPGQPQLNQWGLAGSWRIGDEQATSLTAHDAIIYRFHARDLHLVLSPAADGKPVRFRVTIDGAAPGPNHGTDIDGDGNGTVTSQRLYQLIRQNGDIADHTFKIEFLDRGVAAYAFTFG